jgi:hypothetical protein
MRRPREAGTLAVLEQPHAELLDVARPLQRDDVSRLHLGLRARGERAALGLGHALELLRSEADALEELRRRRSGRA